MFAPDQGLCRVSIHAGSTVVDVALPSQMAVTTLIPPIVDIVEGRAAAGSDDPTARRYQLGRPGTAALNAAMTLAQNGIRDGDVLVLSRARAPVPAPKYDDVAEAVSSTLDARSPVRLQGRRATQLTCALAAGLLTSVGILALVRNALVLHGIRHFDGTAGIVGTAGVVALMFATFTYRAHRDPIAGVTLGVIATAFAAASGFLAVPGIPGLPNVLLAAMTAAVASALVVRISGCGAVVFTAILCFEVVIAIGALAGVVTAAPLRAIGSVITLVSLGLLGAAARLSIILARLSPRLPAAPNSDSFEPYADNLGAKAIRADAWLTSLLAAFSSSAAAGAITTALGGAPRPNCIAFAALTGALLLLRGQPIQQRTLVCSINGIVTTATALGFAAVNCPRLGPWIAAVTTSLVTLVCVLGFATPTASASPIVTRSLEVLECLALIAMVPLTCWVCGLYSAARDVYPAWG